MKYQYIFIILPLFLSTTYAISQNQIEINNIESPPIVVTSDKVYANVYSPLDGIWEGTFTIYEDPNPTLLGTKNLKKITRDQVLSPKFNKSYEIKVRQEYISQSPYFQKVTITDYNPSTKKTEVSAGVNKVQDGQMWCVVRKPSGTVIHEGSTQGDHTIIWQSSQSSPQKIEYFYESISDDTYEIIGYGYYQGDDVRKTPRLWFYGEYHRSKDKK